jgi:threonine dehydratase
MRPNRAAPARNAAERCGVGPNLGRLGHARRLYMHASTERPPLAASSHRLSLERIEEAAALIDPVFLDSPARWSRTASARFGCELTLKDETANPIGCFKGRGAEHYASRVTAGGERPRLVCASAGNFGLALAYACATRDLELTVFVATGASPVKVQGIRHYGARIVVEGRDFDAAKQAARSYALKSGLHFVEDGAEPAISEGAALIARELLMAGTYDALLVPLGNGALLAGMARWAKARSSDVKMIGVCSAGAPVMYEWLSAPHASTPPAPDRVDTIADGIAVRVPVPEAVEDLRPLVDEVLCVDDAQLLAAMRLLHQAEDLMCEPSAAAGLAALAAQPARFAGRRVATVLTGRNLTQEQIAQWFT